LIIYGISFIVFLIYLIVIGKRIKNEERVLEKEGIYIRFKDIMTTDTNGYTFVSTYLISDFTTPIAKTITNLGGAYWLIGISICLTLLIKNKKVGISVLLNLILASLTNYILKQILQRPRPIEYRIIDENGYSLPYTSDVMAGFLVAISYLIIYINFIKKL